jgi:hypothetical protein
MADCESSSGRSCANLAKTSARPRIRREIIQVHTYVDTVRGIHMYDKAEGKVWPSYIHRLTIDREELLELQVGRSRGRALYMAERSWSHLPSRHRGCWLYGWRVRFGGSLDTVGMLVRSRCRAHMGATSFFSPDLPSLAWTFRRVVRAHEDSRTGLAQLLAGSLRRPRNSSQRNGVTPPAKPHPLPPLPTTANHGSFQRGPAPVGHSQGPIA